MSGKSNNKPVPADNGEVFAGAMKGHRDESKVIPWEVVRLWRIDPVTTLEDSRIVAIAAQEAKSKLL